MLNKVTNTRWKHVQAGASKAGFLDAATEMPKMQGLKCTNERMRSWDEYDIEDPSTWVMLPAHCLSNTEHVK